MFCGCLGEGNPDGLVGSEGRSPVLRDNGREGSRDWKCRQLFQAVCEGEERDERECRVETGMILFFLFRIFILFFMF